jgi:hypothetical protein
VKYLFNNSLKFVNAQQAIQIYQYKNIKEELYKINAAIWYNKTCRQKQLIPIYSIIIIFFFFLHGLGRLRCSDIDALPSFPGASTISSSSRFVVEGVFRNSVVVHSFEMVDLVLFVFVYHVQVLCHLIRPCPRLCFFAYEYFTFPWEGYQPTHKSSILGGPICFT